MVNYDVLSSGGGEKLLLSHTRLSSPLHGVWSGSVGIPCCAHLFPRGVFTPAKVGLVNAGKTMHTVGNDELRATVHSRQSKRTNDCVRFAIVGR